MHSPTAIGNDELAFLALRAATAIDLIERGAKSNYAPIKSFGDAMATFAGITAHDVPRPNRLDPASSDILLSALSASEHQRIDNLESLNKELEGLVRMFRERTAENQLQKLKLFCLNLHDLLLRSRQASRVDEFGVFDYEHDVRRQ